MIVIKDFANQGWHKNNQPKNPTQVLISLKNKKTKKVWYLGNIPSCISLIYLMLNKFKHLGDISNTVLPNYSLIFLS